MLLHIIIIYMAMWGVDGDAPKSTVTFDKPKADYIHPLKTPNRSKVQIGIDFDLKNKLSKTSLGSEYPELRANPPGEKVSFREVARYHKAPGSDPFPGGPSDSVVENVAGDLEAKFADEVVLDRQMGLNGGLADASRLAKMLSEDEYKELGEKIQKRASELASSDDPAQRDRALGWQKFIKEGHYDVVYKVANFEPPDEIEDPRVPLTKREKVTKVVKEVAHTVEVAGAVIDHVGKLTTAKLLDYAIDFTPQKAAKGLALGLGRGIKNALTKDNLKKFAEKYDPRGKDVVFWAGGIALGAAESVGVTVFLPPPGGALAKAGANAALLHGIEYGINKWQDGSSKKSVQQLVSGEISRADFEKSYFGKLTGKNSANRRLKSFGAGLAAGSIFGGSYAISLEGSAINAVSGGLGKISETASEIITDPDAAIFGTAQKIGDQAGDALRLTTQTLGNMKDNLGQAKDAALESGRKAFESGGQAIGDLHLNLEEQAKKGIESSAPGSSPLENARDNLAAGIRGGLDDLMNRTAPVAYASELAAPLTPEQIHAQLISDAADKAMPLVESQPQIKTFLAQSVTNQMPVAQLALDESLTAAGHDPVVFAATQPTVYSDLVSQTHQKLEVAAQTQLKESVKVALDKLSTDDPKLFTLLQSKSDAEIQTILVDLEKYQKGDIAAGLRIAPYRGLQTVATNTTADFNLNFATDVTADPFKQDITDLTNVRLGLVPAPSTVAPTSVPAPPATIFPAAASTPAIAPTTSGPIPPVFPAPITVDNSIPAANPLPSESNRYVPRLDNFPVAIDNPALYSPETLDTLAKVSNVASRATSVLVAQPEVQTLLNTSLDAQAAAINALTVDTIQRAGYTALTPDQYSAIYNQIFQEIKASTGQKFQEELQTGIFKTIADNQALAQKLSTLTPNELAIYFQDSNSVKQFRDLAIQLTQDGDRLVQAADTDAVLRRNMANTARSVLGRIDQFADTTVAYPNAYEQGLAAPDRIDPNAINATVDTLNTLAPQFTPAITNFATEMAASPEFQEIWSNTPIKTLVRAGNDVGYYALQNVGVDTATIPPDAYANFITTVLQDSGVDLSKYAGTGLEQSIIDLIATDPAVLDTIGDMTPEQFTTRLTAYINGTPDADIQPLADKLMRIYAEAYYMPDARNDLTKVIHYGTDFARNYIDTNVDVPDSALPGSGIVTPPPAIPDPGSVPAPDSTDSSLPGASAGTEPELEPPATPVEAGTELNADQARGKIEDIIRKSTEEGNSHEIIIPRGSNVSEILVNSGYDVEWNSSDSDVFGGHIAANYDMLTKMWDNMVASGQEQGEFPVKMDQLAEVIKDADAGDTAARERLVRALKWVPAGGSFKVLNQDSFVGIMTALGVKAAEEADTASNLTAAA